jgi:hypothetical protein
LDFWLVDHLKVLVVHFWSNQKRGTLLFVLIHQAGHFFYLDAGLNEFNERSFHQDVAPHFLAESLIVSVDKSEECTVFAFQFWGNHGNLDCHFIIWSHWAIDELSQSFHVVSVSLDEQGVLGPFIVSSVSESPALHELLLGSDLVSVSKILLDKSGIVDDLLLFLAEGLFH